MRPGDECASAASTRGERHQAWSHSKAFFSGWNCEAKNGSSSPSDRERDYVRGTGARTDTVPTHSPARETKCVPISSWLVARTRQNLSSPYVAKVWL